MRMEKQRPQKPTKGRFKKHEHSRRFTFAEHQAVKQLPDLFLCPAFVFWDDRQKNQLKPLCTKDTVDFRSFCYLVTQER